MSEISPTARALKALELLQARPGVTAAELADRLGVTERAARRYVAILREADIPVESTRGIYGGYRLGRGMRLPAVLFTQEEALALVMAVLDSQPAAVGDGVDGAYGDDPVASGLTKVIRALPDQIGRQAADLRRNAAAAPSRRQSRADPTLTSELIAACGARRSVTVRYRSASGNEWPAHVDPWAVVVRFGRWYLVCLDHRSQEVRTYRVDRISGLERTGQPFEPPEDFDAGQLLEEQLGIGWEFPTRVRFLAPYEQVAHWIRPPMGRLEPDGEECVLTGSTSTPDMYAQEWLSTVPHPFRIEEGPELREAALALADKMRAAAVPQASEPGQRS